MRYFEVKVTGCNNCPYSEFSYGSWVCTHGNVGIETMKTYDENDQQLTPSCPMWNETKEDVK